MAGGRTYLDSLEVSTSITLGGIPVAIVRRLDFAFGDVSPAVLTLLTAGDIVDKVELQITSVFNGAPSLMVDSSAGTVLMATTDNNPLMSAIFSVDTLYTATGAESIRLVKVQGGATQGTGTVLITLHRT
jgi:hypothetical protein